MVAVRYAPGDARLVVTGGTVVLIAADVEAGLLDRIWRDLDAGRGLAAVLEALAGAFGTSLAAIPPFVVAAAEPQGLRVAVRGGIVVRATGADGPLELSGAGVTTWTEQVLPGVARTDIRLDAGEPLPEVPLPLRDGVVRAGAAVVDWTPDAAAAAAVAAAVPAPDAGAVPAPDAGAVPAPDAGAVVPPAAPAPRAAASGPVTGPAASALIDSSAVLTISGADTWVPNESTFGGDPVAAVGATVARPDDVADTVASVRVRGDHDGETIAAARLRGVRGEGRPAPEPLAPPRMPAPGRLRLSTGRQVPLDRTVVIGRRPRSTRVTGTDLPHLVVVDSPQQDISRSHLEVRVEGDSILAVDLNTTNGTTLRRAGADPVRLHPGESNVVVAGDVLDLGDGVTVTVEDLE